MSAFQIGDLVWARMKGFPPWPGKIIEPKPEVKKPKAKNMQFVFFFGSENYSWIADENIFEYNENKERYTLSSRLPRGFKEALVQIEEAYQKQPQRPPRPKLPSIDDDLLAMFPERSDNKPVMASPPKKPAPSKSNLRKSTEKAETKKTRSMTPTNDKKKTDRKSLPTRSLGLKRPLSSASGIANKRPKITDEISGGEDRVTHSDAEEMDEETFEDADKVAEDKSPAERLSVQKTKTYATNHRPADRDLMTSGYLAEQLYPVPAPREPKNIVACQYKIGFLGLGIMGSAIVSNLLSSGHEVTVWNRTPSKCRDFINMGASKANTPVELVQSCDIIFSCVSDSAALKDLVFGTPYGLLQGIRPGKSYVDLSTVDVDTITDISDAIMVKGGRFLEAPLIGSRQPAEEGQLIVLASGDKSLYEDCNSCFEAIAKKSFYCGEIGSATKMKLMVSLLSCSMLANLAESLALAEKLSLDQEELLKVVDLSWMSCQLIRTQGSAMVLNKYNEPHCRLHLAQKDLKLAINLSESVDQPMHVGAAVNELFKKAKAKGYGDHDMAAVFRAADM